jgi:predicted acyltransferase
MTEARPFGGPQGDRSDVASASRSPRLLSLDAFRGATILAMILVNNPGTWSRLYPPLAHADWLGWTPTDLIFPFFLFIVGTSLAYSLRKYCEGAAISPAVYWRIVRRTVVLILLGLGMGLFGQLCDIWWGGEETFHLDTLRYFGVLQRIALVYFAASLIVLHVPVRGQMAIGVVILLGYAAAIAWLPNPSDRAANLTPEGNVVRLVDAKIIDPAHWYTQGKTETTDPEGLLSTLPAIVTSLLGYWTGLFIQRRGVNWSTVSLLVLCGAAIAGVGLGWDYGSPIGKKLWTSSFVMLTGGLAMIVLAGCLAKFDVLGWKRLARPFEIVGVNAIFVFVASGLVGRMLGTIPIKLANGEETSMHNWIYIAWFRDPLLAHVTSDERLPSLAMALATVAFWWLILWLISRKGWSVRV